jgi:hypothetical protein
VNPDTVDALAVVVPLISQPISANKFFIVIKRQDHPGIYESVWGQVQDLMTAGLKPLRLPKRE